MTADISTLSLHDALPISAGQKVVEQAQRVLEEASRIKELAAAGRDPLAGPLRLGAIYTIGPYLLPKLIPILRRNAPAMQDRKSTRLNSSHLGISYAVFCL